QHGWHLYISAGLSLLNTQFSLHSWDQSDRFLGVTAGADGYYQPVKPSRAFGVIPMLAATGEILPGKLWVGAAVFVGNAPFAAFDEQPVAHYHLIDGYVVAAQGVIAVSYKVAPWLAVGGTVGAIDLRVHGKRDVFPIINGTDVSKLVGTKPELTLDGEGWAPT